MIWTHQFFCVVNSCSSFPIPHPNVSGKNNIGSEHPHPSRNSVSKVLRMWRQISSKSNFFTVIYLGRRPIKKLWYEYELNKTIYTQHEYPLSGGEINNMYRLRNARHPQGVHYSAFRVFLLRRSELNLNHPQFRTPEDS